jgi:hypothetical protein
MTASLDGEIAAITAQFFPDHGWYAWVSTRKPGEPGAVRVCATRCLPTSPCEPVCDIEAHTVMDGRAPQDSDCCGLTLDAPTAAELRAKLSARCGA